MPPTHSKLNSLLLSLVFGLVIFGICLVTAWRGTGKQYYGNNATDNAVITDMRVILTNVETYIVEYGTPPPNLREAQPGGQVVGRRGFKPYTTKRGEPDTDIYGNRFVYNTNGTTYSLTSYGRDGRPGGAGYDGDYVYVDGDWASTANQFAIVNEVGPGFFHFWTKLPTRMALYVSIAAGLGAFGLMLYVMRNVAKPVSMYELTLTIVSTLIGAIMITYLLAALHVPSTH